VFIFFSAMMIGYFLHFDYDLYNFSMIVKCITSYVVFSL